MVRINDLHPQTRLDLIEEARWQFGQEHVQECIVSNAEINGVCDWGKTRQGGTYWAWIDSGSPDSYDTFCRARVSHKVFDPIEN